MFFPSLPFVLFRWLSSVYVLVPARYLSSYLYIHYGSRPESHKTLGLSCGPYCLILKA